MNKKIAVSGCFDLLHSGHVAFLQEASGFGDLFVCIGSDRTVTQLKGRPPINNEEERRYMVQALRCVTGTHINSGSGLLDFIDELRMIRPDMFIVNEDGHSPRKEELCRDFGIEYKVLRRVPSDGLPVRSTTSLRTINTIPFRIDLAGGGLDQPFVSKYASGPVLTISIEPTVEFNHRSGMASSSRNKAIEIWKTSLPAGDPENTARILFSCENPPGTDEVSGSQDALGICLPGLNRLEYEGSYWPERITSVQQEDVLDWLEEHLYLVAIGPRGNDYRV
ncbi:MAG: adenylyltransferase/cytidyltransferase family protein, partial [Bacteroidota bacterium]